MARSKPGAGTAASPAKPASIPVAQSPARPASLATSGRTPSIITPQSPTLTDARVVAPPNKDDPSSVETVLRPLSPHDVLCGRGGLVNGYVGNVTYRNIVAERRTEYLAARKRDKAEVARSIVRAVLERGGMFLRRVDEDNKKGGTGGTGGAQDDGRSSRWADIGEARAREKTSQALREGLDVRGKGAGDKNKAAAAASAVPMSAEGDAAKKKRGRPPKSKTAAAPEAVSGAFVLTAFLPYPVAAFLSHSTPAITTPGQFAEATKTQAGRDELAASLSAWSGSSAAVPPPTLGTPPIDPGCGWLGSLRTVQLWRDQVKVWTDALTLLQGGSEGAKEADSQPPSSPAKKAKKEEAAEEEQQPAAASPAPSPSPRRGTRGGRKKVEQV